MNVHAVNAILVYALVKKLSVEDPVCTFFWKAENRHEEVRGLCHSNLSSSSHLHRQGRMNMPLWKDKDLLEQSAHLELATENV